MLKLLYIKTYCGLGGAMAVLGALAFSPCVAEARLFGVESMPASGYADTEVSTNFALHVDRADARRFGVHLELAGSSTSELEVALGLDVDMNGVLDWDETETIYGWRNGRYFIENVRLEKRVETETSSSPCIADILVENSPDSSPIRFFAVCGQTAAFTDLAASPPPWLYDCGWNMVRIVRRGAGSPSEWVRCEIRYDSFAIRLR